MTQHLIYNEDIKSKDLFSINYYCSHILTSRGDQNICKKSCNAFLSTTILMKETSKMILRILLGRVSIID